MDTKRYQLPDPVYTPNGLASAVMVSPGLIRKEIRDGRLRAHRLGGKLLRILREDAEAWLNAQPTKSEYTNLVGSAPRVLNSRKDSGAQSGAKAINASDIALRSV